MIEPKHHIFESRGKLLLTGEYVVLDGAMALAIPTKFGQNLTIETIENPKIYWTSFDDHNELWFEAEFQIGTGTISTLTTSNLKFSERLQQIFQAIHVLNPDLFGRERGYKISTQLDFPRNWGLGSSSTLINNLANWADIDPFLLLDKTFGGSGYDIACASASKPILYQITKDDQRKVQTADFNPTFKDYLYFVHLNRKQNSREGINHYRQNRSNLSKVIVEINKISKEILTCDTLVDFQKLIEAHESIISRVIELPTVKDSLFKDFEGSIKSLGAWGGDFILVASKQNPIAYFSSKGYTTILDYQTMVYN
ncbi:GYDIA family GHMP kinase [Psychroserpens sp. XS_ASV72]|uniref:GYDIA family GHMP kinase n=1 Tax=Psychroserpens sp. XS_ASV72 TaxID=3241293 RepID=UPI003517A76B